MRKKTSPAVLALWIVMGLAASFFALRPGAAPQAEFMPLAMAMPASPMMAIGAEQGCSDHEMTFGDEGRTYRADEHRTMAAPASLTIEAAKNGPLSVRGSDRSGIAITICKAAAGDSREQADAVLRQIKLVADGGRIAVTGPDADHWGAALIVEVPRAQALTASAANGPVSLKSLTGNVGVNIQNGPLSMDEISGNLRAEAKNGPVDLKRGSGDVEINSHNGPLMIELTGARWNGHLTASTHNGPLQVRLPKGFASGVEVESGNGPFSCRLDSCGELRRSMPGEAQHVKIGGDPVVVHLRADHGPVEIESAMD
jgi:hypothetical protein